MCRERWTKLHHHSTIPRETSSKNSNFHFAFNLFQLRQRQYFSSNRFNWQYENRKYVQMIMMLRWNFCFAKHFTNMAAPAAFQWKFMSTSRTKFATVIATWAPEAITKFIRCVGMCFPDSGECRTKRIQFWWAFILVLTIWIRDLCEYSQFVFQRSMPVWFIHHACTLHKFRTQ